MSQVRMVDEKSEYLMVFVFFFLTILGNGLDIQRVCHTDLSTFSIFSIWGHQAAKQMPARAASCVTGLSWLYLEAQEQRIRQFGQLGVLVSRGMLG